MICKEDSLSVNMFLGLVYLPLGAWLLFTVDHASVGVLMIEQIPKAVCTVRIVDLDMDISIVFNHIEIKKLYLWSRISLGMGDDGKISKFDETQAMTQ
jgi:hypothetical protein